MPNKSSHANHTAERSCVVCKQKRDKTDLFRFVLFADTYIIDMKQRQPGRGLYICPEQDCLKRLNKWIQKRVRKKRK